MPKSCSTRLVKEMTKKNQKKYLKRLCIETCPRTKIEIKLNDNLKIEENRVQNAQDTSDQIWVCGFLLFWFL